MVDWTRRAVDPRARAEAAFKAMTSKPSEKPAPAPAPSVIPTGKETVSLRIDRDILQRFQEDGPGWQDRINKALRDAAGL